MPMARDRNDIKEKKIEASDPELELFRKKHNLKTDLEAYEFLKKKLSQRLGLIP